MDPITKYMIEKRKNVLIEGIIGSALEKKFPNFKRDFKEAMKFVDKNWFVVKDTFRSLYGVAIAMISGISGQPVSMIAKKLKK